LNYFKKNNLFTNLAKILSATVLAQAISLAFSPILTRLYMPEAFGFLAFVLSVSNPFSSFSTFRLEQAVVLPKDKLEAKEIANTVIFLNTFFSILLFIIIIFWGQQIFQKGNSLLIFIPLIVLVSGFQMPLNSWLQREKKFNQIAQGKIFQAISISIFSILFFWYHAAYGLLLGYLAGWAVYAVYMFYQSHKNGFSFIYSNILVSIKSVLKNYKEFPLYHVIPSVAVSFTLSIPIYYFNTYYSEAEIGWFNFSRQLLIVPVSLVTAAFSQVYYARVVELKNHSKKIFPEFKKLIQILILIAGVMTIIFAFGSEILFEKIFGKNWVVAGQYASILVFSTAFQLIVWPLNTIPVALGKIKFNSLFQLLHFLLTLSLFFLKNISAIDFIYFVVLVDVIFYSIYFIFIVYQIKAQDKG
jgi:O-antigen/teichoic acid export membrane protein